MSFFKKIITSMLFFNICIYSQEWNSLRVKANENYSKGNYSAALIYGQEALKEAEKDYGKSDINYSISLSDLALIKQKSGEFGEAEALFQIALQIRKNKFGENNLYSAVSYHNLAVLYNEMGQFEKAKSYCFKAIKSRENIPNSKKIDISASLNLLALIYQNMNYQTQADSVYAILTQLSQNSSEDNTIEHAAYLNNRASRYIMNNDLPHAEALLKESINIITKLYGSDHPTLVTAVSNLASLYKRQKKI